MNHTMTIKIKSPLLRPGLELSTEVSIRYLVPAMVDLLDRVREFNDGCRAVHCLRDGAPKDPT